MRLLYCIDLLPKIPERLRRIIFYTIIAAIVTSVTIGQFAAWPGTNSMNVCMMTTSPKRNDVRLLHLIQFGTTVLCFILIVVSYSILAMNVGYQQIQSTVGKNEMLTLRTLFIIGLVYILSYLTPYIVLFIPRPDNAIGAQIVIHFFTSFLYIQSALNPVILFVTNTSYRKYIKQCFQLNRVDVSSGNNFMVN